MSLIILESRTPAVLVQLKIPEIDKVGLRNSPDFFGEVHFLKKIQVSIYDNVKVKV